jgi:hypothetical protein
MIIRVSQSLERVKLTDRPTQVFNTKVCIFAGTWASQTRIHGSRAAKSSEFCATGRAGSQQVLCEFRLGHLRVEGVSCFSSLASSNVVYDAEPRYLVHHKLFANWLKLQRMPSSRIVANQEK